MSAGRRTAQLPASRQIDRRITLGVHQPQSPIEQFAFDATNPLIFQISLDRCPLQHRVQLAQGGQMNAPLRIQHLGLLHAICNEGIEFKLINGTARQ